MTTVTVNQRIEAPRERVWEVFTALERAAETIRGIEEVEVLTPGPMQLGTRWRETRKMFGKSSTEEMEVTSFEPPERYVVEAENRGTHYRSEFRFRAVDGATEVEMDFGAEPGGAVQRVLAATLGRMAMKSVVRMMSEDMADLKRVAESDG